ncbi:hypothetical protein D3C84_817620 [compost metagenome]
MIVGVYQGHDRSLQHLVFVPAQDLGPGRIDGADAQVRQDNQHDIAGQLPEPVAVSRTLLHLALEGVGQVAPLQLGFDAGGGLDHRVEETGHRPALITDGAVAEREVGLFHRAVAIDHQREVLDEDRLARQRAKHQGTDAVPRLAPDLVKTAPQRFRLGPEDRLEGIVVDSHQLRPPDQATGEFRCQQHVHGNAQ